MSDFRINELNSLDYILDYKTFIVTDKSGKNFLKSARKLDINEFIPTDHFDYIKNNYINDLNYYSSKSQAYSSEFFNIENNRNKNIIFFKDGVVYTPSGKKYSISSTQEDEDYGKYYEIERNVDGLEVSYNISSNLYNKEKIDELIDDSKFILSSDSKIIDVDYNSNVEEYDGEFVIKNKALYTDGSTFNVFEQTFDTPNAFIMGNNVDNNGFSNVFCLNSGDLYEHAFYDNFAINGAEVYNQGFTFNIIRDINDGDYIFSPMTSMVIIGNADGNGTTYKDSFIISKNVVFEDYSDKESLFVLGDWNDKTLYMNSIGNFEFNRSGYWSFYVNEYGNFYVGSLKHKMGYDYGYVRPYISFGEEMNTPYTEMKFVISHISDTENVPRDLFYIFSRDSGVFYRDDNLIKPNMDDIYEHSGFWDMVIHKDELDKDIFYIV